MEHKPKFCSECGAKLTGSAAFCPECGAKQEFAAAATPAPKPVVTPAPVPQSAPAVVAEPVVIPAPVATAAPDNSLAAPKKAGLSVVALILAIGAVLFTGLAFMLQFVSFSRSYSYKIDLSLLVPFLRQRGVLLGMLSGYAVPLLAVLAVLIKKKPVAIIGMILTLMSMMCQLIVMLLYSRVVRGQIHFDNFSRLFLSLMNWVNGDSWLFNLWNIFRSGMFRLRSLFSAGMVSGFSFWCKNFLALLACLLVVIKKKK